MQNLIWLNLRKKLDLLLYYLTLPGMGFFGAAKCQIVLCPHVSKNTSCVFQKVLQGYTLARLL